jgi:hypothetical protein
VVVMFLFLEILIFSIDCIVKDAIFVSSGRELMFSAVVTIDFLQ